jgi:hypothetical protein
VAKKKRTDNPAAPEGGGTFIQPAALRQVIESTYKGLVNKSVRFGHTEDLPRPVNFYENNFPPEYQEGLTLSNLQTTRFDWPKIENVIDSDNYKVGLLGSYKDSFMGSEPAVRVTYANGIVTVPRRMIDSFFAKWVDVMFNPPETEMDMVNFLVAGLYSEANRPSPRIHWYDTPIEALQAAGSLNKTIELISNLPSGFEFHQQFTTYYSVLLRCYAACSPINSKDNTTQSSSISSRVIAAHTLTRAVLYDAARTFGLPVPDKYKALVFLIANTGIVISMERDVYLSRNPIAINFDARGRLHNDTEATIRYSDNNGFYFWHGVHVPDFVIARPETITLTQINEERNAEVRRVMVEYYGAPRYILDMGGEVVDRDHDSTLYLFNERSSRQEPLVCIKLRNSTPEGTWVDTGQFEEITSLDEDGDVHTIRRAIKTFIPQLVDGKPYHKDYFIRVDPNAYMGAAARSCKAAKASLWRNKITRAMVYPRWEDFNLDEES